LRLSARPEPARHKTQANASEHNPMLEIIISLFYRQTWRTARGAIRMQKQYSA
jgi:hypothetical protein